METVRDISALYHRCILGNYGEPPVTLVKGEGARVWDNQGREYLDFASGIAVTSLGHCHPRWVRRVQEQAAELAHCSNLYRIPNQALLAEKLVERAGPGKVLFQNSGTEAVEALLKLARLHGQKKAGREGVCHKVICAEEAFHGRTFGGMAATPQEKIQGGFRPMLDGFVFGRRNDLQSFAELADNRTAGILLETIQGESGILPCGREFLQGIRKLCDEKGLLLLLDEVQCGAGRTGKFFNFEHAGIRPDAVALAKGLGGGFPIGAVWIGGRHAPLFKPGSHGCTFGGSPLACAAALAVMETIESENLLENVASRSVPWIASLKKLQTRFPQHVAEARGQGYLAGVEMKSDAKGMVARLREAGMLAVPAGHETVRLLPPLTVAEEDLARSADIFGRVLAGLS